MESIRLVPLMLITLFVLAAPVAGQLPSPEMTFIPDQISAESSFVMIADPGSVGGSVRIDWVTDEGYGSLPNIDGQYMCYFSDTDYDSTCGPSPFRYPTTDGNPYVLDVATFDSQGNQGNASIEVDVGGLKIIPDVTVDFDTGKISILAYTTPSIADSVSYEVFDSGFSPRSSGYLPMERITGTPYFNSSADLEPGTYYIAFKAESGEDFGGGMIKVSTGGGSSGTEYEGAVTADPIDIDVLVEAGSEPALPANKRVINTLNQTIDGVSIVFPTEIARYLSITIPNSTLQPYQSVFYTITLRGVTGSLDINTVADIKSGGGAVIGKIPVEMRVSYTDGGSTDCSVLSDGADCLGGICCNGVCRKKASCCVDSDCASGRCTDYSCETGASTQVCSTGTCMTGTLFCPSGQIETGTCSEGGESGICCLASGECAGKDNLDSCSDGVCCYEECVEGDCCSSLDCPESELCQDNVCTGDTTEPSGEGIDFFTIILIAVIVAVAALGGWLFYTKYYKKKSSEEEFGEEGEKDTFDDEEFY